MNIVDEAVEPVGGGHYPKSQIPPTVYNSGISWRTGHNFHTIRVNPLNVPIMGTDNVGPLLIRQNDLTSSDERFCGGSARIIATTKPAVGSVLTKPERAL